MVHFAGGSQKSTDKGGKPQIIQIVKKTKICTFFSIKLKDYRG
jgi:hypothetical protein